MDRSGKPSYTTSSNDYVKEVVTIVETRINELGLNFTKSAKNAQNLISNIKYRPELDIFEL